MDFISLGKTAISVVNNLLSRSNSQNGNSTSNGEDFNVQGHINNMPVDIVVERGSRRLRHQNSTSHGKIEYPSEPFYTSRSNIQTERTQTSSNPYNTNNNNKGAISKPFPKNLKKSTNEKCLLVKVPDCDSNFEVHIKKTSSNFSNLSIKPGNRTANQSNIDESHKYKINKNKTTQKSLTQNKTQNYNANDKHKNKTKCVNFKTNNGIFVANKPNGQNKFKNMNESGSSVRGTKNLTKTWMYLGRLKIGTSEFDLKSYLIIKFPNHDFEVKSLPLYREGKLPCFKVLVDNDILELFQEPVHWPSSVTIKKYQKDFKA